MEKKSLARNILGLFVSVEDDQTASKNVQNSDKSTQKTEAVRTVPVQPPPAAQAINPGSPSIRVPQNRAEIDQKIASALAKALEEANLDGFDYFEFARTIDALKATIPSEPTLYQSAFASATVMGASKITIVQSAQHYLQVLEKKASEFGEAVTDQYKTGVEGKIKQSTEIDELIKGKALMIQKITDEINTLSKQKETLLSEVEESKTKIEAVKQNYEVTWNTFNSRIRADIDNINKYLST
jgi:hypothetical protein